MFLNLCELFTSCYNLSKCPAVALITCMCHVLPTCDMSMCDETHRYLTCSRCLKGSLRALCLLPHDTLHLTFPCVSHYDPPMQGHCNIHLTCLSSSHMHMCVSESV